MSGELPVCRGASRLGRVSPISTVCGTLLGSESGSMLSESMAQPRVTQYTAVSGSSSRTLVASGSNSGELNCEEAKRRDGRDSAASGSYCSLLLDGVTRQSFVGPAPSVEDWMYERRHSREGRGSPYVRKEGAASPWFDRSFGRPLYGHYRSVGGPYWSSDGQNRSPIVQRRSISGHFDGPYRSTDGHFAGPLDGPYAGQVRAMAGPQRSNDRSPPEREVSMPVNRAMYRGTDGPSRSPKGLCRSPERTPTGPRRSTDSPRRSIDGLPLDTVNLIDLGMLEEPKDSRSRILTGYKAELAPVKTEQNGIGQSRGPSQHKVRGSPIPADETSDEDADELPPTGRRRSIGKSHRASKRRHHKLEGEANSASDGLKVKVRDKHRRDDSPGSSSSSSRSTSGHRKRDNRRSPRQDSNRKSPDPPDKGSGRDRRQDRSPPSGGDDKKSNKDDGKKPDKAGRPPAKDGDDPKKPSSTGTGKSVNVGTDAKDNVKRVTSSYVSNRIGTYDGTTCLETFLARFDKCVKYMGWDEEDQQFNLSVSLEGAAGQILWDVESCSTVEETIGLLRNRFGNVNQAERFHAELRARRRRPGESLQQLYQDVSRLMSLAYPGPTSHLSNIVARDAFLEALGDNALRVRILEKEPTDLDSALKIACRLAAYDGGDSTADYRVPRHQPPGEKSPKKPSQKFNRQVCEKDEHRSGHPREDMFHQF